MKIKKKHNKPRRKLLPFSTIQAASKGDAWAILTVLQYYEGYINQLSLRPMRDANGCTKMYVDEAMRHKIKTKLITGILEFRAS